MFQFRTYLDCARYDSNDLTQIQVQFQLQIQFQFQVQFQFQLHQEITPEPINSSSIYQATNCPSVMALCGVSKSTYAPPSIL